MVNHEIRSDIEAVEKNAGLYKERNFDRRAGAIDRIEFHVIDRIEGRLQTVDEPKELLRLKQYAEQVKRQLEEINDILFQRLRANIRAGGCRGTELKGLVDEYVGPGSSGRRQHDEIGYDSLDLFINGLLLVQPVPVETKAREPEMVYYQQTPARIVFELVEKAHLTEEDVFYDLGSGLGQVPILVNLLSGATAKGIEFEPAYCDYSRARAADLNLSRVEFMNDDARTADYSEGTVFFMYTPFEGGMLREVLQRLREESLKRNVRLFTYGPCTSKVSRQSWLKREGQSEDDVFRLGVFESL